MRVCPTQTPMLRAAWRPGLYAVAASRHSTTSDLGVSPSGPHRNCRPDQGMSHKAQEEAREQLLHRNTGPLPPHTPSQTAGGGATVLGPAGSSVQLTPACLPGRKGPARPTAQTLSSPLQDPRPHKSTVSRCERQARPGPWHTGDKADQVICTTRWAQGNSWCLGPGPCRALTETGGRGRGRGTHASHVILSLLSLS